MSDIAENDMPDQLDLFSVRGLAIEAIQTIRSHEKMDDFRFKSLETSMTELKNTLEKVEHKIEDGFKRNDNRFWSMGISLISLLITCCGFLVWEIITKHG